MYIWSPYTGDQNQLWWMSGDCNSCTKHVIWGHEQLWLRHEYKMLTCDIFYFNLLRRIDSNPTLWLTVGCILRSAHEQENSVYRLYTNVPWTISVSQAKDTDWLQHQPVLCDHHDDLPGVAQNVCMCTNMHIQKVKYRGTSRGTTKVVRWC